MTDFQIEFNATLDSTEKALLIYSEEESLEPYAPGKWNKKEVIGHLIDSACNNHARFVTGQFRHELIFSTYDQNQWVLAQAINSHSWKFLVTFWKNYNLHLIHIISRIPNDILNRKYDVHNFDQICWKVVPKTMPVNLEYLIKDYYGHLKHHLGQILK